MILDFHDDLGESYLVSLGANRPPELLKEASWSETEDLLDRDFALIIIDENGKEMRKFACHDEGNIAMSLWYLENVAGLPEYATKVAAYNLSMARGVDVSKPALSDEDQRNVVDERRVFVDMRKISSTVESFLFDGEKNASSAAEARGLSAFDYLKVATSQWDDLDPFDRREFAVTLLGLEKTAGISVSDHISKYGGTELSPRFTAHIKHRISHTSNPILVEGYERLAKVASVIAPADLVQVLYTIDQDAGLLHRYGDSIADPVLAVFGQEKQAEWSWINGGYMVNERQLIDYSNSAYFAEHMSDIFVPDIVNAFRKAPVATFKGMPIEQQQILSRLATQGRYGNDGGA